MSQAIYGEKFYQEQEQGSLQSAKEILPLILQMMPCNSVVDVGCGVGNWLIACAELGISDLIGVDGDYVDTKLLKITEQQFVRHDLTKPLKLNRPFDLVISVEVAEHLTEDHADTFIDSLTELGSVILFSAAIPHQGGTYHVNEQWPAYWIEKFDRRGYRLVDCIRAKVWTNEKVEWWYAQNMFLFVRHDVLQGNSELEEASKISSAGLSLVHPRPYLNLGAQCAHIANPENRPVRVALHELIASAKYATRRRLRLIKKSQASTS